MVGIHLVAATLVGLVIGYALDGFFGTMPWLTMIFLFLGIATGFRDLFRMIKFNDDDNDDEDNDNSERNRKNE